MVKVIKNNKSFRQCFIIYITGYGPLPFAVQIWIRKTAIRFTNWLCFSDPDPQDCYIKRCTKGLGFWPGSGSARLLHIKIHKRTGILTRIRIRKTATYKDSQKDWDSDQEHTISLSAIRRFKNICNACKKSCTNPTLKILIFYK